MGIPQNRVPKQQPIRNVSMASPGDPKPHQPQRPPRNEDAGMRVTCITDNRKFETPQTRIEKNLDDLSKEVADISSKICDGFVMRYVENEKQLVAQRKESEELRSELQSLKEQLQQEKADNQAKNEQPETKSTEANLLRSELQSLKKQLQQQEADNQAKNEQLETKNSHKRVEQLEAKSIEWKGLRSELQSLKEQLQQQKAFSQETVAVLTTTTHGLDEDKKRLREVILGDASRHEVSEYEIRKRFVNIRRQIEAIVNNPAYDKIKTCQFISDETVYPLKNVSNLLKFEEDYNGYGTEYRVLMMRTIIYVLLYMHIFGRDHLGLAGYVPPVKCKQKVTKPLLLLDWLLGSFLSLSRASKGAVVLYLLFSASSHANIPLGANEDLYDWRLGTFKCTEKFSAALPPRDNSIARDEIQRFLLFFLDNKLDSVKTRKEIDRLCDDAFDLWLFTRRSGHGYQFDSQKFGVKFDILDYKLKVFGVLGDGEASNYVAEFNARSF
ncbi:hypothetical protein E4U33_000042 [Claviceps sp. LM78 group G4]|nr:hypothetical protein E4U33_000042 [Claviceps sp. LM78 group G4]